MPESLRRFLAVIDRTWPLGRLGGVEIRIHVATLLVPVFALWSLRGTSLSGGFRAAYVLGSVFVLYVVVLVHEFGHILAARRYGIPSRLVTLSPLGGLAHLESPAPNPKAEIFISLAGPATNLAWWGLAHAVLALLPEYGLAAFCFETFAALNLALLLFNLLPFFPLDGGRTFRALMALKLHPNRASIYAANVGIAGGAAMILFGLFRTGFGGFVLLLIGLRCLQTCLREKTVARYGEGPYASASDPWAVHADAWKSGRRGDDDAPETPARKPGFVARIRLAEAARAEVKEAARRADLQAELDGLLEKVGRVGLAGMTDDERAALRRASDELKRRR